MIGESSKIEIDTLHHIHTCSIAIASSEHCGSMRIPVNKQKAYEA
jgi:hypothetical protein